MTPKEQVLEALLNFELIEELGLFFHSKDRNKVIDSLLACCEKTFPLCELSELDNKLIWIGLSNYQKKPVIKVKFLTEADEYYKQHELYRTDANIILGKVSFDSKTNSFSKIQSLRFFIDSWEGNMSGDLSPNFAILEDNFRYKKVS